MLVLLLMLMLQPPNLCLCIFGNTAQIMSGKQSCSCYHLQPPCADLALAIALDEMPEPGHSPDPQLLQCPAASQQLQAAAMTEDPDRQLGEEGCLAATCPARACCSQVLSLPCSNTGLLR